MTKNFTRIEKKYLIDSEKKEELLKRIGDRVEPDVYGKYRILNIYFDTDNDTLIRTSIEKPPFKEKLRMRSYTVPGPEDTVFLELKKKYNGTVYKRRINMSYGAAMDYIKTGIPPEERGSTLNEIDYFMRFYSPKPKLFLAYDREAFVGKKNSELRITFDANILSRRTETTLDAGDYGEKVLGDGVYIMEIKVPGAFPMWLARELSELKIYPASFSKYGTVYMNGKGVGCNV